MEPEKDGQRQEMSEVKEQTPLWLKVTFLFIDLIICTPPPSWKKYAILSL